MRPRIGARAMTSRITGTKRLRAASTRSRETPAARPTACSQASVPSAPTGAEPIDGRPAAANSRRLAAHGVQVAFRASLEQDLAAIDEHAPEFAIGTTPVVQAAKQVAIPALYFTNLISARPLMGPAGAGSLAQVINTALANRDRFAQMRGFFEGVGQGETAGVWQGVPRTRPEFKVEFRRRVDKQRRRDAEEPV